MPERGPVPHHLAIFQYGDLRAACARFDAGGDETYLDQRRAVAFLRDLARRQPVTVVSVSDDPHDEVIEGDLRSVGAAAREVFSPGFAARQLARLRPDIAIAALPEPDLIGALCRAGLPVFACFADVMRPVRPSELTSRDGLRRLRRNARLRRLLAGPSITAVGNHSLSASRSLHRVLGLDPARIVPWEWSRLEAQPEPKAPRANHGPMRVFFAGTLMRAKGVGDLLEAMAILGRAGKAWQAEIAGNGPDRPALEARARALDLDGRVTFLGTIPHDEVRARMRAADAVAVPSHHDYAEGLPNVIFEALAARTPLILSDHPAYADRLREGDGALVIPQRDPAALAAALTRLQAQPELAARLSGNAAATLDRLYVGMSWYDALSAFVADPGDRTGWVARNSLARLEERLAPPGATGG